ncbi:MAG: hypothetical protein K6T90_13390, partial [Leptolyngbyaceae cyanobacterium HOT.MB2.61]|nr:hypothetical protein [Leptolyngbyaceae cyanobacterium HOT.MB2.61]
DSGDSPGIAVVIVVRTGCRGGTPGWGQSPYSLSHSNVLTHLRKAINITTLTGVVPRSGDSAVLKADSAGKVNLIGRLQRI